MCICQTQGTDTGGTLNHGMLEKLGPLCFGLSEMLQKWCATSTENAGNALGPTTWKVDLTAGWMT